MKAPEGKPRLSAFRVDEGMSLDQHWVLATSETSALRFVAESYGCTQGQLRSRFPEIDAREIPWNQGLRINLPDGTSPLKSCGNWVAYFKREHEAGNLPCVESLEGLIIASTAWEED